MVIIIKSFTRKPAALNLYDYLSNAASFTMLVLMKLNLSELFLRNSLGRHL